MVHILGLRAVSATALTLASTGIFAQEALPPIDVGAARRTAIRSASTRPFVAPRGQGAAPTSVAAQVVAPVEEKTTYRPQNATTALKTNTPIMETPVSIQVVPQQVLQDQQDTTISRAVEIVSGVIATDAINTGGVESYIIRGFQTFNYYRDGVRVNTTAQNAGPENMANVDRIEILKGPASILYGRAEPGGIVNLITKQPLSSAFYAAQQQIDSWGSYRTTLDATGPLTKDDTLLYRVNFAFENNHAFYDFSGNRSVFVAPTVRWNPDEHTQLNVYLDYKSAAFPKGYGLPALTNRQIGSLVFGARPLSFLPRAFTTSDPWSRGNSEDVVAGYRFSHNITEHWNITHRFQAELVDLKSIADSAFGFNFFDPTSVDRLAVNLTNWNTHTYYTNLDLTGKFDTFGLSHTLLVGGDFQHLDFNGHFFLPPLNFNCFCFIPPLNLVFPIYTSFPTFTFDPASRTDQATRENWYGFYVQDQIKLPYNLFLLAGARYDHAVTYDVVARRTFDNSEKVSPRFGLLWRPVEEMSVYGSYVTNFGGANISGRRPLPPETAQQWEVGVKTEWFDKRLTATFAYYYITKQNVAAPDPDPALALQGFLVAVGEVRNKGAELDIAGEILPGWKVIGGYSYIDSLITKDRGSITTFDGFGIPTTIPTLGNTGNRLFNVPRQSGSIWTTYEIQDGDWRGLKFGGGVVARSIRQGNNANDFQLPGYATVNLMAGYDFAFAGAKVKMQLNVDNVADTRYYPTSANAAFQVFAGAPRTFRGMLRVEY